MAENYEPPNGGKTTSASVGRKIKSPTENYEPPNGGKTTSASVGRKIKSPVEKNRRWMARQIHLECHGNRPLAKMIHSPVTNVGSSSGRSSLYRENGAGYHQKFFFVLSFKRSSFFKVLSSSLRAVGWWSPELTGKGLVTTKSV